MPGFHRRQLILSKLALRHRSIIAHGRCRRFLQALLVIESEGAGGAEMRLPIDAAKGRDTAAGRNDRLRKRNSKRP